MIKIFLGLTLLSSWAYLTFFYVADMFRENFEKKAVLMQFSFFWMVPFFVAMVIVTMGISEIRKSINRKKEASNA